MLPWQPDHGSDTSGGDRVTKNKTVASTEDTHHYDKNYRRSIAGKVEDCTPRSATQMCYAANDYLGYVFLEPALSQT